MEEAKIWTVKFLYSKPNLKVKAKSFKENLWIK
jgi:hypothetical protein